MIRVLTEDPVEIREDFFKRPVGRTDLLKAPEWFPMAESRYTLRELTVVWHMYGGSDLAPGEERGDPECTQSNR